jgi:hypothetical protein
VFEAPQVADLRRPNRVGISGNLLASEGAQVQPEAIEFDELHKALQQLFDQLKFEPGIEDGASAMSDMGMTDLPPQYEAPLIVAATTGKVDRTVGVCRPVGNPMRLTTVNSVGPLADTNFNIEISENRSVVPEGKIDLLRGPRHGTLQVNPEAPGGYLYLPVEDYVGSDRATFMVQIADRKIRVEYFFRVLTAVPEDAYENTK